MAASSKSKSPKAKAISKHYDPYFYRLPHPIFGPIIALSMIYLFVVTFVPEMLPSELGPITTFGNYMATKQYNMCIALCYLVLISHSMEAAWALKLVYGRGYSAMTSVKWVLSVFILGFPSMMRLVPHKPGLKKLS